MSTYYVQNTVLVARGLYPGTISEAYILEDERRGKQSEEYIAYQMVIHTDKKSEAGKEDKECCEVVTIFKQHA